MTSSTYLDRIDGVQTSIAIKAQVKAATTANITLSGEQTIDGIAVVEDERVLVWNQTDDTENGIYDVATTSWARSKDFNGVRDAAEGSLVYVIGGTSYGGLLFQLTTTDDPIVFGTSSITFNITLLVNAPSSSTDNALVRFDGESGYKLQDSLITQDDSGNLTNNGASMRMKGAFSVRYMFERTGAATDMGKGWIIGSDGSVSYQNVNDAETVALSYMNSYRHPSFRISPDSNLAREFGRLLNNTGVQNAKVLAPVVDRFTVAQKASQTDAPFGVTFASSHNGPGDMPEEKLLDSNFDTAGDWTVGAGWSFGSNKATKTAGNTNTLSTIMIDPLQPNVEYSLGWQVEDYVAGSITVDVAGVAGSTLSSNTTVSDTILLPASFVDNGTFDLVGDFGSGWSGTGWTYDGTEAIIATAGAGNTPLTATSNTTLIASTVYRLWFYCGVTAGTITPSVGGTAGTAVSATQPGWFFQDITSAASTNDVIFTPDASFEGSVDVVKMIPISMTFTPTSDFDGAVSANLSATGYMLREKIPTSSDHSVGMFHRAFDGALIIFGRANAARQVMVTGNEGDQMLMFGGNANEDNMGVGDFSKGTIPYGSLTGAFVVDDWAYDTVSGAVGQIVSDTGTVLELRKIFGTFGAGNIIRGRKGGQATTSATATLHIDELDEQIVSITDESADYHVTTRISQSPAAGHELGGYKIRGRNSAGVKIEYTKSRGEIVDPTSTSEEGRRIVSIMEGGAVTDKLLVDRNFNFQNRNKIINGGYDIWQRGTSFAIGTAAAVFQADRWQGYAVSAITGTFSRQGSDGDYRARIQRTAGDTNTPIIGYGTVLSTANVANFAGKEVTISFKLKAGANFSPTSGNVLLKFVQGEGTDESCPALGGFATNSSLVSTTYAVTTTETRFSKTLTLNSTTTQLAFNFWNTPTGTAGADDWYEIGEVQLEIGDVITTFEKTDVGTMLAVCRQYARVSAFYVPATTAQTLGLIDMRVTPTISGGGAGFVSTGTTADTLVAYQTAGAVQTLTLESEI